MKKIILITVLFTTTIMVSQEKWRTITFTTTTNSNLKGDSFIPQFTVSLDYEINNNFFISSWNGYIYNNKWDQDWFTSQTTLDKRVKNFTVGVGYLYTTGDPTGITSSNFNNDFYISVKAQYRIKL